jgi:hypothetical protein
MGRDLMMALTHVFEEPKGMFARPVCPGQPSAFNDG